jgi:acyl carrier protein
VTNTLATLNDIFRNVTDEDSVILERATTAADVESWDSLNHIQFVVAIEKHFKIKFTRAEIGAWQNVGDLADAVERKLTKT